MAFVVKDHKYIRPGDNELKTLIPIATEFKGEEFRSRTEADQAVIFDALDLRVDWEPYGITLPSGERYLPDAYIRDSGILVEIKRDGIHDESMQPKHHEALEFFNDPDNYGIVVEGFEDHPITGMVVSPAKQYLNDPNGEFADYHEYRKKAEVEMYEYILTVMGVEDDPRFEEWSETNLNFDHVRRAIIRGMKAKYEHGQKPLVIGYRNITTKEDLIYEYGTDKIHQHTGKYLWDYMTRSQYRELSNSKLGLTSQ